MDWNPEFKPFVNLHLCHTLRGCVDWNLIPGSPLKMWYSHTLRGCVDWNNWKRNTLNPMRSHTLRGCVDWNQRSSRAWMLFGVTPCVGVWIETLRIISKTIEGINVTPCVGVWIETWAEVRRPANSILSHPAWVCGLKHRLIRPSARRSKSHTLRGCVDWNLNLTVKRHCTLVTPCVGVWIETTQVTSNQERRKKSHPAWVCGLKP